MTTGQAIYQQIGQRIQGARNMFASADGRLELFVVGNDGALWHIWQTTVNGGWSNWISHGNAGVGLSGPLALAPNADGRLELFARGKDGALWHIWQTTPSGGWSSWTSQGT